MIGRAARIDQRTEKVETGWYLKHFAYGGHGFHPVGEQRGMQVGKVASLHAAAQQVAVGREPHAMMLYDIACSRSRGGGVITVFGYFVTGSCHYETGAGGDVERVFIVTACPHDVNDPIRGEIHGLAGFYKPVAQAEHFVHLDAPHNQSGEQGTDLHVVVFPVCNMTDDLAGLFPGQNLTVCNFCEYLFHACDVFKFYWYVVCKGMGIKKEACRKYDRPPCLHIGMWLMIHIRLSPHDFSGLELRHHQYVFLFKNIVRFVSCFVLWLQIYREFLCMQTKSQFFRMKS